MPTRNCPPRERSEYNRAWRLKNIDRVREKDREYRARNKKSIKAYLAAWHALHPEKVKEYYNKPERRAKRTEYNKRRYREQPLTREAAKEKARRQHERIQADPVLREKERAWRAQYRDTEKAIRARRRRDLARMGVTLEQYDALFARQSGVCALCRKPERWRGKARTAFLTVDHCHQTGRVRGLLCRTCNRGLGLLGDTVDALGCAFQYLRAGERG